MARCKFCGSEITWMKEGRKNVPVNGDGSVHRCEEMMKSMKSIKTVDLSTIDPDVIAQYEKEMNKKK